MLIAELFKEIQNGNRIITEYVNWEEAITCPSVIILGQTEEQKNRAIDLRHRVANFIEQHEELWDQSHWQGLDENEGEIALPECGTACCVAGWTARFVAAGQPNINVPATAIAALWCDGRPLPPFHSEGTKEEILTALRA